MADDDRDQSTRTETDDGAIQQVKNALAGIDLEGIGSTLSKTANDVARQLGLVSEERSPYIVREEGAERQAAVKVVQGAVALPVAGAGLVIAAIAGIAGSAVVAGVVVVLAAVVGIAGATRMSRGRRDRRLDQTMRRVSEAVGADESITLNRLAHAVGLPATELESVLREAIQRGLIPEGRVSGAGPTKTLFLTDAAWENDYHQHLDGTGKRSGSAGYAEHIDVEVEGDAASDAAQLPAEARELLEACVTFEETARTTAARISDKEVAASLISVARKVIGIANYVRRHPQTAAQLRRMTTYYLPTTAKLAQSYVELEGAGDGPQATSTRAELKETFARIDEALAKVSDDVLQYQSMDLKSEADVLQTMLKQDGLSQ